VTDGIVDELGGIAINVGSEDLMKTLFKKNWVFT